MSSRKRRRESEEYDYEYRRSKRSKYDESSSSSSRSRYKDDYRRDRERRDRDYDYDRDGSESSSNSKYKDEYRSSSSSSSSSSGRYREEDRSESSRHKEDRYYEEKRAEERKNEKEKEEARKIVEEAKLAEEEENKKQEEQEKLNQEMMERKERIAKWRENVFKKKLEEQQEVENVLQQKEAEAKEKGEAWSFDDDNNETYSAQATTDQENTKTEEIKNQNTDDKAAEDTSTVPPKPEEPEEDPLDAFMKELTSVPIEKSNRSALIKPDSKTKEDNYVEEKKEEEEEEDWKQKVRKRDLEQVDHSTIAYRSFRKDFYIQVPEISKMTKEEAKKYRNSLGNIRIRGKKCPRPIKGFHQCGLSDRILDTLKKFGYIKPSPIQALAIPAIMSGKDVIGIAKTGSGKTLAFLLPLLRHMLDQDLPQSGEGPIGIIMAPTRELVHQIHSELRRFSKRLGIKSVCIFGGSGISHQIGDLKRGAAVAVCTPGRMIDILCTNAGRVTNLRRVTYLVLDEADRMFDMGFEPQIMRIIDNIRPDRQTVMFSATFPRSVEAAARKILKHPIVEIIVGGVSVVCSDVTQIVEVRKTDNRFTRLLQLLGEWNEKGSILVFVNQQDECDHIYKKLLQSGYSCSTLHAGKDQMDRASTIADFKTGAVTIMVATSVAARGLDVASLNLVVNYSAPNHYENYVHRCGRTGRAGRKGTAVTFITEEEDQFAPDLVKALHNSGAEIPPELQEMSDAYNMKVSVGNALKHGSGFHGSGYKFDEAEAQAKKKQENLQRKAYLGEEADDDEDENDADEAGDSLAPLSEVQDASILAVNARKQIDPQTGNNLDEVIRNLVRPVAGGTLSDEHTAEVEINDYPQQARWKVTHKDALAEITEFTGCAITARGTYTPPPKQPPVGQRKLFLYIEGPDANSVYSAVHEIKRILKETAASAFPERERHGKYSIQL